MKTITTSHAPRSPPDRRSSFAVAACGRAEPAEPGPTQHDHRHPVDHHRRRAPSQVPSTSSSPSTAARCTSGASGAATRPCCSSPGGATAARAGGHRAHALASVHGSVPTHGSAPEPATRHAPTQTFETQAPDLHALARQAGEPGPYVVVGHSFGGAEAVTFTSQYPDEVTGLMLVDASPTTWPTTACSVAAYEASALSSTTRRWIRSDSTCSPRSTRSQPSPRWVISR